MKRNKTGAPEVHAQKQKNIHAHVRMRKQKKNTTYIPEDMQPQKQYNILAELQSKRLILAVSDWISSEPN